MPSVPSWAHSRSVFPSDALVLLRTPGPAVAPFSAGGNATGSYLRGVFLRRSTPRGGPGAGEFGAGFEVRITRHVGWMNDFSWNVVDGPKNNFGMARSGLIFAF